MNINQTVKLLQAAALVDGLDKMVTLKAPMEYGILAAGAEDAIMNACFKLNVEVLEHNHTGIIFRTLNLRLRGRAEDMLTLCKYMVTLES